MEDNIKMEYDTEIKWKSDVDDDQCLQIKVRDTGPGDLEIKVEDRRTDEENSWLYQQAKKKKTTESSKKTLKKLMFECEECGIRFTHSNNLSRHKKQFHSKDSEAHPCDSCDKVFARIDNLALHKRTHNAKKETCKCGKQIKLDNKNHKYYCTWEIKKNIATAERYKCDICLKKYKNSHSLNRHKMLHFKHHNYFCDYCNLGFKLKIHIRKHIITKHIFGVMDHTFKCEFCGKKYTRKAILTKHLISHTDAKPFSCSKCGKTFQSRWGWRNHESRICTAKKK